MTDGSLQALIDERAIVRLLHDYGHHIDYGEGGEWLELFVADARYVLRYRSGLSPRSIGNPEVAGSHLFYQGHAALAAFISAHSHAPDRWHKHVVTNWRIELGCERATVTSYFLRIDATDAGARIVAAGRYLDVVVCDPEGRWRFAERIAEIEMQ